MTESEIIQRLISCQWHLERVVAEINKELEAKELKRYLLKILEDNSVDIEGKKVKFNRQKGAFIFRVKENNTKTYTFSSLEGWDGEYWKYDYLSYPIPAEIMDFVAI